MQFVFNRHEQAPLFNDPKESNKIIKQIISEMESGRFSTVNEELRQLFRQAGFVNLWFFLKFIAGYAGPYDRLGTGLHLDMCNFRQSPKCMDPGSRFAGFLPRSSLKSTILTHGAAAWEALRWPDIRILITNSVEERAKDFCSNAFRVFRNNELVQWLYPEYIIPSSQAVMTLPNRKKYYTENTFNYKGFGGELAGTHINLILFDDIVGIEDLDSNMSASLSMERAKRKFATSSTALLVKPLEDRVGLIGTRYAVDDVYEMPLKDCKTIEGYPSEEYKPKPDGTWHIYYRRWFENGASIDPETYDPTQMAKLRETDPWAYTTQYNNSPSDSSALEFRNFNVHRAFLEKRPEGYILIRPGTGKDPDPPGEVPLSKCYTVTGVDFAGTSTGITARTSKTAIVTIAQDGEGRRYLIDERSGYWAGDEMVRQLFAVNKQFEGYINMNILESNAMQKALIPLIRDMAYKEELYFPYTPTPVHAPKDVRIRTIVGTALGADNFYICDGTGQTFIEEKDVYPQSEYRKDVLDAAAKAISALHKPWSDAEDEEYRDMEEEEKYRVTSRCGY